MHQVTSVRRPLARILFLLGSVALLSVARAQSPEPAITPSPSPSPSPAASPSPTATPSLLPAAFPTPALVDPSGIPSESALSAPPPVLGPGAQSDTSGVNQLTNLPGQPTDPNMIQAPDLKPLPSQKDMDEAAKKMRENQRKLYEEVFNKEKNKNVPDLTLDKAVGTALQKNPDLLNAVQQIRLTRGQIITVTGSALPQLAITPAYTYSQPSLMGSGPLGRSQQNQTWNITFGGSQLLFDGGAAISGIKAAGYAEASAFYSLRKTVDDLISQVKIAFSQVILNRALILAQQQSVTLLQQQLQDQQNRYEAGTVPRFNVLQAEVALANALPGLITAENNYRTSQFQLVKLIGMDYAKSNPSEIPFNVVGDLNYTLRDINTEGSIRTAVTRSPTLKAQRQTILAQAANVNVAIAGYLPNISANGGYQVQNNQASMDVGNTLDGWYFGFTGTWNVWDSGQTYGRVDQAKAQLFQAKNNYDNSVRQVILDVQTAISNLQQARETIDSQTASVVQATEALRLARERLDAGAGTQLDVLNQQVALLQAQTTELQARFSYIQASAQYDRALSINTKYEELFDDPLTRAERRQYAKINNPDKPQPPLPNALRKTDPIAGLTESPNAPLPITKERKGKTASATPAPSPAPKKKKGWFGI